MYRNQKLLFYEEPRNLLEWTHLFLNFRDTLWMQSAHLQLKFTTSLQTGGEGWGAWGHTDLSVPALPAARSTPPWRGWRRWGCHRRRSRRGWWSLSAPGWRQPAPGPRACGRVCSARCLSPCLPARGRAALLVNDLLYYRVFLRWINDEFCSVTSVF